MIVTSTEWLPEASSVDDRLRHRISALRLEVCARSKLVVGEEGWTAERRVRGEDGVVRPGNGIRGRGRGEEGEESGEE